MIQDFKFAFRQLIKAPGFTAVAVLTLALAIGVNSAIFALINSVVLHPMVPIRPQEVVNVFNCRQNANHDYRQFSYNEYREIRENGELFADLAALEFAVAGIGRDRPGRARYLGTAWNPFAARLRLWRFRDDARFGESKKLRTESRRTYAIRPNDRHGEVADAGVVAKVQRHAAARFRVRA